MVAPVRFSGCVLSLGKSGRNAKKEPRGAGSVGKKFEAGRARALKISGDYSLRDPPVPIPNTEVKPQLR